MREFIRSGAVSPHSMTAGRFRLGGRLSWRDPDVEATLVLSQPDVDPDLWDEFACGAEHSFRKHGVEDALDVDALRTGSDTILFCAAIADGSQGSRWMQDRVVAERLNLDGLALARCHHLIADFRIHPGQLRSWFSGPNESVSISMDSIPSTRKAAIHDLLQFWMRLL